MKALITDTCAVVHILDLLAGDAEEALLEILYAHSGVLVKCGLTADWLAEYGRDEIDALTPQWNENIRIHTWMACYTAYESDDETVTVFVSDPQRAKSRYTGLMLAPSGEYLVFTSNAESPSAAWPDVYARINEGLPYFPDDVQEAFASDWLQNNNSLFPHFQDVSKGLSYAELTGCGRYEGFNSLRIYLFDNLMHLPKSELYPH
jgi:hypothetical protein